MRNKNKLPNLFLALLVLASMATCKREDPCENERPLDFKILERLDVADSLFVIDTTYNGAIITFEAPEGYLSYSWKIGNDPREFTRRKFNLDFDNTIGKINVRLIATRPRNADCNPKDDGVDTLTKSFVIVPFVTSKLPLYGTFVGYNTDEPTKKVTVIITFFGFDQGENLPYAEGARLWGLLPTPSCDGDKPDSSIRTPRILALYKVFYIPFSFYSSDCRMAIGGWGEVDANRQLRINYTKYTENPNQKIEKTFIGKKQ
jgi:hypothetical protein